MACIGGILIFVAVGMVKPAEVREVLGMSRFHIFLMLFTAVMVVLTDFLVGVLSALVLYAILYRFLDRPEKQRADHETIAEHPSSDAAINAANPH